MSRHGARQPSPTRRSILRASAASVPAALLAGELLGQVGAGAAPRLDVPIADPNATQSAIALAALLDGWSGNDLMAVGQQLNVNGDDPFGPVTALDAGDPHLSSRIRVLGWTTNEWDYAVRHHYNETVLDDLAARAKSSTPTVLVTSWYPRNPRTGHDAGNDFGARPGLVAKVLTRGTPERTAFLQELQTRVIPYLKELQSQGVATIFRPLIEANGFWFWWGCDNGSGGSATWQQNVRKLYRLVQKKVWAAGVHNVLWSVSFAPKTSGDVADPVAIRPRLSDGGPAYDLAGISAYDFEANADDVDELPLQSYAAMCAVSPRMALGEVGPQNSNGNWDPHVITSTLQTHAFDLGWKVPSYGMFWFDDGEPDTSNTDGSWIAGKKQLASLVGGKTWLATSNADGLIDVVP